MNERAVTRGPAEGRRRARGSRADARRRREAILDAAVRLFNQRPQASMVEVAVAAGVSRQTIYAHFDSRPALVAAVFERMTEEILRAVDEADLDRGPPADALGRLLEVSWRAANVQYPLAYALSPGRTSLEDDRELHRPIFDRLERLIRRGQAAGEFDPTLDPAWLLTAMVALSHAAGEEVAAGRMEATRATTVVLRSTRQLLGVAPDRDPDPTSSPL